MMKLFKSLGIAITLGALFSQSASAAVTQIIVRDANGNFRNFNVTTNTDITGNLLWNNTLCDQATGTLCATVTGANALKVDGTGGTFPVSGTVAATQSGTWTVTGAGGTFPATQSGAWTVNPTTIGTWGLQLSTQNSATPTNGLLGLAQFNTTPTTLTTGNVSPLQMDNAGNLLVNIKAGAAAGGTSSSFGAAFPGSGTATGMSQGGNMVALTGTSNNLNVQCANCSGSGVSTVDAAAFTASSSLFVGGGGFFQTTATNSPLTTGQQGMFQVTANRALFTNLRNVAGAEVGTAAVPLQVTGINGTFPASQSGTWTVNPTTIGTWGLTSSTQNSSISSNANVVMGQFNTTPTTITTGNVSPLQMDNAGNLLVNIKAGAGSGGTALADAATFTQGTTSFTPAGCFFNNSVTNLTSGQGGAFRCTNDRTLVVTVTNANTNGQAVMASSSPVVIASNQSAIPITAATTAIVDITNMSVATGSAPPAKAIYTGTLQSGATGGLMRASIQCDLHVFKHITSATDTLAVQGVASQIIYVCGWRSRAAGVATWFLENTASANANCSSSNTQLTGVATEAANTGETILSPYWNGVKTVSGNGLCINSTGTGGVDVDVFYAQL